MFPVSCNILYGRSHDLLLTEGVQNRTRRNTRQPLSLSLSVLRSISFSIDNPPSLSLSLSLSLFLYRFTGVCSTNCWKETERSHDLLLTEGVQNRKKKHEAAIVSLSSGVYPSLLITLSPFLSLSLLLSLSLSLLLSLYRFTGVCSTNCWKETGRLVFPVAGNILYGRSHDLLLTEGVQNN